MKKVLIANRGEIAVRIARGCAARGIASVAVYSEADATAAHVLTCDEAIAIGPAAAHESYLCGDKILDAAAAAGADAIHPGYGFLSENADFAEAVSDAGLIWIGPPAEAIRVMGTKIGARERMEAAGVPVVPGIHTAGQDLDALVAAAEEIGFPVLVKASSGGGGKGMRAVSDPAHLRDALEAARREAESAFADGALYLERLLIRPRHIEIQIFGDSHGQVVHIGERECSIQRRHQKIVEESPSPVIDAATREAMGAAAVAAGASVGYVGAGTVEFMLDQSGDFFFLEMNTRLQVEHPVTEEAYGVDLVAAQLDVAMGAPLPWTQADIAPRGHAIEVRLYAEDPTRDFLPATGQLRRYRPPQGPGVRHDGGYREGDEVGVHYDPMLAKLIVSGVDREAARRRLVRALADWEIHGVITNLPFLAAVAQHPDFMAGDTHTGFIPEHFPDGLEEKVPDERALIAMALADALGHGAGSPGVGADGDGAHDPSAPWRELGAWRGTA